MKLYPLEGMYNKRRGPKVEHEGCVTTGVGGVNLIEEVKSAKGFFLRGCHRDRKKTNKNVILWKSREDNNFRLKSVQLCGILLREPIR